MALFDTLGFSLGKVITYWRHTIRYATTNAKGHAGVGRPLSGDPSPYPYLRELVHNALHDIQALAERYARQEQKLRAKVLTTRGALERARASRLRAAARNRESVRRFRVRHGEDAPLSGGTRRAGYHVLLVVLTILETWINSQVFAGVLASMYGLEGYGDFELWGFSMVVALLLVACGHYLGLNLRNEKNWTLMKKALAGVGISVLLLVLGASLALRAADPAQSIGMASAFTGLNAALAALGTFVSFIRHPEGDADVVATRRDLDKARKQEEQCDDAFRQARAAHEGNWNEARARARGIAEFYRAKVNAFKDVLLLKWERGQEVPDSLDTDLVVPLPEVFLSFEPVPDVADAPADEAPDIDRFESPGGEATDAETDLTDLNDMAGDGAMPASEPTLT